MTNAQIYTLTNLALALSEAIEHSPRRLSLRVMGWIIRPIMAEVYKP